VLIRFEGPITPMLEQYFYRKLAVAREKSADLVVVEIDSPGGLLESSLAIADRLRDLDWAHTVAYIPREAISGAAIAALGCDEIVMHPHALLGDAGPIYQDEGALFRHVPEKFRSHLAERVRNLAEAKGRPPALAEAMVDMDLVVYRVKNKTTGAETFMSDEELAAEPDEWEKIKPVLESREDHFLEVNGKRAVEVQLAEGNVSSRDELKTRYKLTNDLLILQPSAVDTAVYILNRPLVTGLLFVVGLVALYVEFSVPGISIGGLTAGLCFALFFWSRFLGGTAGLLEVVLFVAGLVFLAVELFVFPGFGVAGLAGLLLVFAAVVLACQDFVIPHNTRQWDTFGMSLLVTVGSGVTFIAAAAVLTWYYGSVPLLGRLVLKAPDSADVAYTYRPGARTSGATADAGNRSGVQVGDRGIAESLLRPGGRVRFGDDYVDVVTEGSFVNKGSPVKIIEICGNRVIVREIEETA
jgi:membrane-bound serine protease (ClpP class)